MTKQEVSDLGDLRINCELLEVAINALESLRKTKLPEGLSEGWVEALKKEQFFQISEYDNNFLHSEKL